MLTRVSKTNQAILLGLESCVVSLSCGKNSKAPLTPLWLDRVSSTKATGLPAVPLLEWMDSARV